MSQAVSQAVSQGRSERGKQGRREARAGVTGGAGGMCGTGTANLCKPLQTFRQPATPFFVIIKQARSNQFNSNVKTKAAYQHDGPPTQAGQTVL